MFLTSESAGPFMLRKQSHLLFFQEILKCSVQFFDILYCIRLLTGPVYVQLHVSQAGVTYKNATLFLSNGKWHRQPRSNKLTSRAIQTWEPSIWSRPDIFLLFWKTLNRFPWTELLWPRTVYLEERFFQALMIEFIEEMHRLLVHNDEEYKQPRSISDR